MGRVVRITLGIAACLAMCAVAYATVTYNADGTGFVGKGDVQLALGWNNGQLQANATGVSFTYRTQSQYEAVCTWQTGPANKRETHNVTHTRNVAVSGSVQYDARTHRQIDGFILTGLGTTTETGEVPVVGGQCVGQGQGSDGTAQNGIWSSVTGPTTSSGGLYVNYADQSVLIGP